MIAVRVLFFAQLRECAGCEQLEVSIKRGASLDELWAQLIERMPQLAPLRASLRFALNQEYVRGDAALAEGDEVALIPPVSGG
ncbi:MAG TPA: molybdopterin converting factor subunit 1 [Terriglobales bacterium]|nr:molybdopterin converting factor subunit 1 [Terriglobales bacterium]